MVGHAEPQYTERCSADKSSVQQGKDYLRGEADVLGWFDTTSEPTGDDWKGDCAAEPAAGVCRSPDIKRNILLPGATGDLSASLLSAGCLSVGEGMGDLQKRETMRYTERTKKGQNTRQLGGQQQHRRELQVLRHEQLFGASGCSEKVQSNHLQSECLLTSPPNAACNLFAKSCLASVEVCAWSDGRQERVHARAAITDPRH